MKTSTVLKNAKKYLAKDHHEIYSANKEEYICYSVNSVCCDYDDCSILNRDQVKAMIADRLGGQTTLEDWLEANHGISVDLNAKDSVIDEFTDKLQATRHAWIDSMISEFKAKGD